MSKLIDVDKIDWQKGVFVNPNTEEPLPIIHKIATIEMLRDWQEEVKAIPLYCLKASSDYHSEVCEECIKYPNCDHTIQDDVTETIIKALEQMPSEDCVSRQAIDQNIYDYAESNGLSYANMKNYILDTPSVTPTRKVGKWENGNPICPCCGEDKFKDLDADIWADWQPKYCPNCGAEMEGEE